MQAGLNLEIVGGVAWRNLRCNCKTSQAVERVQSSTCKRDRPYSFVKLNTYDWVRDFPIPRGEKPGFLAMGATAFLCRSSRRSSTELRAGSVRARCVGKAFP